jgi:gluconokinase
VRIDETVQPDPADAAVYAALLPIFAELYTALVPAYTSLRRLAPDLPLENGPSPSSSAPPRPVPDRPAKF